LARTCLHKLDKIYSWARGLESTYNLEVKLSVELAGNLTNIANLAEQATGLEEESSAAAAELEKGRFLDRLDTLKAVLLKVRDIDLGPEQLNGVSLYSLFRGDEDDFKTELAKIDRLDVVNYILAILPLWPSRSEYRPALNFRALVLAETGPILAKLVELEEWLEKNRDVATHKQLVNRGIKVSDLVYDARQIKLPEAQREALVDAIEAVEAKYLTASREVGAQTKEEVAA
jgi:hypothetical protein